MPDGPHVVCLHVLTHLLCYTLLTHFQTDQESLAEVDEKYKKAMVSNAQLDNDKGNLIYQVDTLKDVIEEMEEQMAEMRRELEEKSKVRTDNFTVKCAKYSCGRVMAKRVCLGFQELERQKHTCSVLQHKQEELKEGIRQRDELIEVRLLFTGMYKLFMPV